MQRLNFPFAEADRCVQCGLCSRVCPTYALEKDERASPRGRIALMRGWAAGALPEDPELFKALDMCLGCLACEAACPAEVPYGRLLDITREGLRKRPSLLLPLMARPRALGLISRLFAPLLRPLGFDPLPLAERYPPEGIPHRGDVALFKGCLGETFDGSALSAAISLLNAIGFGVVVPKGQTCCGALHLHRGYRKDFERLKARNLRAFDLPTEAVVGLSSGCNAVLSTYPLPFADIHRFLRERWPKELRLRPLKKKAVVHIPCSLRHPLKGEADLLGLLRLIPDLELHILPPTCCGAAGDYMLRHRKTARALRERLLSGTEGDVWVSPNLGCALHLRKAKPFISPLLLLAGQLP